MRELHNKDWRRFCERLNTLEGGATVTIEIVTREGVRMEVARTASFEGIAYDRSDDCNDVLTVRATGQDNGTKRHTIIEPMHIKLKETETGAAYNSVLIEAENGITVLTFHPVLRPQWLEGLALS
jgi:hypothetical protein